MKASKILAGLSALSIAASMLSMVASADDDYAAEAPAASDDGASYNIAGEDPDPEGGVVEEAGETTGAADNADCMFNGIKYNWNFNPFNWGGTHAYAPYAAYGAFPGWPGWGVRSFATPWKLYEDYLKYKDSAFEVWGIKNDNTVPGYLVFEYDDGNKYVIPLSVDKNGEVSTDEIPVFQRNVNKIYFLFEISDAPCFDIKLNKVNIGGTDIPIVADNMGTGKYASDATPYVLKIKPNGKDGNENNGFQWVLNGDNKKESKAVEPNSIVVTEVDENGNEVLANMQDDTPVFYKATFYDVSQLNNDFDDDFKFDKDKKYDPADNLYDNNHDEPAINHRVWLPTQKMKITFTVSGIGSTWIGVNHSKGGDNKGDDHAEVKPNTAGGVDPTTGRLENLDVGGVNPYYYDDTTRSRDLYDSLVEVWNSSPEHNVDAEIKFKTVSDKNGVLVANFINVWELDVDDEGNAAHWLKEFKDGYATYVKEVDAKVQASEKKYGSFTYYQGVQLKDANGALVWEDADKTIPVWETENVNGVEYYKCVKKTVQGNNDLTDWGQKENDVNIVEITEKVIENGVEKETSNKHLVMDLKPIQISFKKADVEYKVAKDPQDAKIWAYDHEYWVTITQAEYDAMPAFFKAEGESRFKKVGDQWFINLKGIAVHKDNIHGGFITPVGKDGDKYIYPEDPKKIDGDKVEEAYCWHPYFVTENGLVDIVTKNYLGDYLTNEVNYNALTDARIKYLADNNGMYYNDNIHSGAYGHFVVFGDNTEREYGYRIKAEAIGQMLNMVQRSVVAREEFVYKHGALDIYAFNRETDTVKFGPNGELILEDATGSYKQSHEVEFTKDRESWWYDLKDMSTLDSQMGGKNPKVSNDGKTKKDGGAAHRSATHGAIWLQCCEGTYLKDVTVRAHTDLTLTNDVPKLLYGKENYEAMYPKKPVDSSSAAAGAAAQPTAAAAPADENAPSGAAAGFGIAGLLLAGAAMVCAKKKS